MGVILEINPPAPLPDLVESLKANGCVTSSINNRACHVVHSEAKDAAEEWSELHFFVRAWQVSKDAEVTLRPDESPADEAASG